MVAPSHESPAHASKTIANRNIWEQAHLYEHTVIPLAKVVEEADGEGGATDVGIDIDNVGATSSFTEATSGRGSQWGQDYQSSCFFSWFSSIQS